MKRRFRITITPDDSVASFRGLENFVHDEWGIYFYNTDTRFKSFYNPSFYVAGIEVFDKNAKAL